MDTSNLQYVTDENGEKTAVVVPIEEWNEILEAQSEAKKKEIAESIKRGMAELEAHKRGEIELTDARDFLRCLWDSNSPKSLKGMLKN